MFALLKTWSLQELRHHPWRSAAAACAVMLGVALAFAVHTINASALDEFSQAVRSINGQPDLELRAVQGSLDEAWYGRLATHPEVARASPVLELTVVALKDTAAGSSNSNSNSASNGNNSGNGASASKQAGTQTGAETGAETGNPSAPADAVANPALRPPALRVIGADALLLPAMAPALMPRPFASLASLDSADRFALFAPATVFLNGAALQALGLPEQPTSAPRLLLQTGLQRVQVRVAGTVAAGGAPLAVMDIGAAQDLFGRGGELTRIDLQLQPGALRTAFRSALEAAPGWSANLVWAEPGDAAQSVGNLSRAYRVNLTVLALVALFTGAYLVFSVLALSVAQRAPQFALLAVLGATPRQRLQLVLAESLLLGLVGSAAGIALGTALAAAALSLLGGDLGGGYFAGAEPVLQWSLGAALLYGALGVGAAVLGGWWPARSAQGLAPAQALKGLGQTGSGTPSGRIGIILVAAGAVLTQAPAVFGIPLAAYLAIALLLVGGIALLPWGVALLLRWLQPLAAPRLLPLLALERARRTRGTAAVAVGGVVASLSLAVALTVMVTSFRGSVMDWLDAVLPAPLYVRTLGAQSSDAPAFGPDLVRRIAALPGVERVEGTRTVPLLLDAGRAPVLLIARPLGKDAARTLPLVAPPLPVPDGHIAVYASEALSDLWGATPGSTLPVFSKAFSPLTQTGQAPAAPFFVAGVWRDYARQSGALVVDAQDYTRLTGDARANDLALWPRAGADIAQLQRAITALAGTTEPSPDSSGTPSAAATEAQANAAPAALLEFASSASIRAISLRIFDRSFAVTYWLQAVAIGIGLFGVAASFSAQVLARRKEFGLLAHLGLTQRQILAVVAGEGAAWTLVGALAGVLLGLAVSVVLVHVVNPQSFHWRMDLRVPGARLLALCAAVVLAGTVTAWLAGRGAAGRGAVLAVKEDW